MKVKLGDIIIGKNWSRTFGVGDLSELVNSLREHGQLTPVIIDEKMNLVAGFRRYAAMTELNWTECEAQKCIGDPRIINLVENMNRTGLSLWEEIQAVRDVFGEDPEYATVARALSKTRSWATPRVLVWTLPQNFIDKVRLGQATIGDIKRMLADKRGPSAVSKNMGTPSQPEIKNMITWLMQQGREWEANALSYAAGGLSAEELKNIDYEE